MKHYLRFEGWIRRGPSVAVITGVVVVLIGWGMSLLTRFSVVKTANAASAVSEPGHACSFECMGGRLLRAER